MTDFKKEISFFDDADFQDPAVQERWANFLCLHCTSIKACSSFWKRVKAHLKSKEKRKYFLTLTSASDEPVQLVKRLKRIVSYYDGELIEFSLELTKSKLPHIHALWMTRGYPRTRDLYRMNNKNSVDNKLVKTTGDLKRIKTYIRKDVDKMEDYINLHELYAVPGLIHGT